MANVDKQLKSDQCCEAGSSFSRLFYDMLEKKRHLVSNLYSESATLVWNGNAFVGKENITKFYETLPMCKTDVRSLDAQNLINEIVLGQTTILVSVSGIVTFTGFTATLFTESFLLTAQPGASGEVWKIVSDCFRFHETVT